jgi:hypothetical protein
MIITGVRHVTRPLEAAEVISGIASFPAGAHGRAMAARLGKISSRPPRP